jgi:divalent metal cation (Fe/Co/Zn/Cd) transporter
MNEAVHSLMDTANQAFLFLGLMQSARPADQQYAFGHGQKKYLWNLWSAIGLFSIGSGLGIAHAWHSWHAGPPSADAQSTFIIGGVQFGPATITLIVLATAILLEGFSFFVATKQFLKEMRRDGFTSPFSYFSQSDNPTLIAVVLEDSVAMIGLVFAALGIGLSAATGNYHWDIGFSVLIAAMLGLIAIFLGIVNMRFLSDIRDSAAEELFSEIADQHPEVERFHDLRSVVIDDEHTVLVAEIELREEAILNGLQQAIEFHQQKLLEVVPTKRADDAALRTYIHNRAAVQATLERTEQIIEELVAEIQQRLPRVFHVTIEVEGIATRPISES